MTSAHHKGLKAAIKGALTKKKARPPAESAGASTTPEPAASLPVAPMPWKQ